MDLLDRLLEHDEWTTRQLLLICEQLTDEQLDEEFDIGHRSVRATLAHIVRNVEVWADLMTGQYEESDDNRRSHKTNIVELQRRLDDAAARLNELAREVADRNGWDDLWVDTLDNTEKSFGGAIAHVLTHSMHHRAQVLYLLRLLGVDNRPEGDVFSWELREASP